MILLYRRLGAPSKLQVAEDEAAKAKEERLFRLYQNIEEMMDNFEGYLEQSREQMEQEKAQVSQQLEEVRELCKRMDSISERVNKEAAQLAVPAQAKAPTPADGTRPSRHDTVRDMLAQGMAVEQIAQALDASINEIKLIAYGLTARKAEG